MACTKIFSGDLPEITNEIIQYFRNDFSTLHSCILVNRLWCLYLYNLSDDDKIQSKKYGINNDLFPSNILFNYSSFIQYLDIYKIYNSITMWVSDVKKFKPLLANIKHSQHYDFVKFIYKSLIKIFNENEANLHTLDITHNCTYLDTIVSELALNSNFIYNIRNLYLKFYSFNLCHLIDSQQNLKKISLNFNSLSLYNSLLLSKNPNCTNTLRTIIFYLINFKNLVVSNEIFEQLNVLESIHILYCYSLDSNFFQQIINLTKPFKLKSLFIDEEPLTDQLQLLLQKFGNYLENFGLELVDGSSLLQLVKKVELSLNYISIDADDNVNLSSVVLQNLGQILEKFTNHFINKLLIKDTKKEELENKNNLSYIKEYIMKKKRIKFLALIEIIVDLFSLKDEVNEFRLYDIIVQNYCDLSIETDEFIYEMY
ncbi:hypothetical protein RhiirA1_453886 [Rhizophagus irregularis]|uniref:F-box domain-containing protein n=1 Tax=Rhizophagus irregularis TaxID=588596 RepID=A0A2N0S6G4_9GLOM|nr:hypothetical protein RhiirA1_453886 [Rhizophagus irregularis]